MSYALFFSKIHIHFLITTKYHKRGNLCPHCKSHSILFVYLENNSCISKTVQNIVEFLSGGKTCRIHISVADATHAIEACVTQLLGFPVIGNTKCWLYMQRFQNIFSSNVVYEIMKDVKVFIKLKTDTQYDI